MSESKWKKANPGKAANSNQKNSLADGLASVHLAVGTTVRKHNSRSGFIQAMLGHASRNAVKLDLLDAPGQAEYLRHLFDHSHIIIGIWPDASQPDGYGFMPIKGNLAKLAAAFPNNGAVMISGVGVKAAVEAEYLAEGYAGLDDDNGQARWELAMPANRGARAAMAAVLDRYDRYDRNDRNDRNDRT